MSPLGSIQSFDPGPAEATYGATKATVAVLLLFRADPVTREGRFVSLRPFCSASHARCTTSFVPPASPSPPRAPDSRTDAIQRRLSKRHTSSHCRRAVNRQTSFWKPDEEPLGAKIPCLLQQAAPCAAQCVEGMFARKPCAPPCPLLAPLCLACHTLSHPRVGCPLSLATTL